jgi:hypothetical protein
VRAAKTTNTLKRREINPRLSRLPQLTTWQQAFTWAKNLGSQLEIVFGRTS